MFLSMFTLTLCEMLLVKCLYICKWGYMAMKDDDFITSVILGTNILLSSLVNGQDFMLNDVICNPLYGKLTGQIPNQTCVISLKL